jgi:hypothetical protein
VALKKRAALLPPPLFAKYPDALDFCFDPEKEKAATLIINAAAATNPGYAQRRFPVGDIADTERPLS